MVGVWFSCFQLPGFDPCLGQATYTWEAEVIVLSASRTNVQEFYIIETHRGILHKDSPNFRLLSG